MSEISCHYNEFETCDPSQNIRYIVHNEHLFKHYLEHGPIQPKHGFNKVNGR
jgi:hypothetical protein